MPKRGASWRSDARILQANWSATGSLVRRPLRLPPSRPRCRCRYRCRYRTQPVQHGSDRRVPLEERFHATRVRRVWQPLLRHSRPVPRASRPPDRRQYAPRVRRERSRASVPASALRFSPPLLLVPVPVPVLPLSGPRVRRRRGRQARRRAPWTACAWSSSRRTGRRATASRRCASGSSSCSGSRRSCTSCTARSPCASPTRCACANRRASQRSRSACAPNRYEYIAHSTFQLHSTLLA